MQDKMMESFNEQTRQFFEPMRRLNSLLLGNMEKMTEYQLDAMKRYSQMGTERMRSATEIQDADDLREFGTQQAEMMNALSQQMMEDAKALSEMSLAFKNDLEALFTETGQQMSEQARKAGESAKAAASSSAKPAAKAEAEAAAKSETPAKATSQAARSQAASKS
ncbi:phasin family protein [Billgrantia azerbaijanica]|nr:phasin family protein [Halomonas azerbaijanica]